MTCETCRFWEYQQGASQYEPKTKYGECHRSAPTASLPASWYRDEDYIEVEELSARWPMTDHWTWCGEHQPREVKQ